MMDSQTTLDPRRSIDWKLIEQSARALGVREKNLEKWRQRKSVPHKWRLPIIRHAGLSIDAFDDFVKVEQVP